MVYHLLEVIAMEQTLLHHYAQMIDHTNLHADATSADMQKLCQEACDYHFKMVAINQVQSATCAKFLKDSDVHVGAAIAFPLGQTSIASKVFETKDAIKNGADEIDYVINLTKAKEHDYAYLKDEMQQIVTCCKDAGVVSKVIFENCYLTDEEKIALCQIAKEVQPDFIKTSTGFGTGGATVEDVALMVAQVGDKVKVKAAGGIRDAKSFLAMIQAGAQRIGTSSGIKIMEELKNKS